MMPAEKKPVIFTFTTAYHPFIGGAEIAIHEVARRLSGEFRFCIITARMRRSLPTREERPEGTVIRVGFGTPFDKWLLPFAAPLVFIREGGSAGAVLWGVDVSAGALGAALAKFLAPRARFVLTIQYGSGGERLRRGRFGAIGAAFYWMLGRADAVTAISNYLAAEAARFGYPRPVALLPNGVALEMFLPARSLPKQKSPPTVITVSRLVPKNGVDILIRAVAEIQKSIPEVRCHILGSGPERGRLEELARARGLTAAVTFFGDVPYADLPRYLAAADVFVRPSRSEGLGNAFVEALASGLPVVGTPVEGILDIIADGKTGLFAKVDDPADVAEKTVRLLRDRALATRLAAKGQAMVKERFSWAAIAAAYGRAFRQLLAPHILIATGIYPPDIGGPATYSVLLQGELLRRGHRVAVVTYGPAGISRRIPKGLRHLLYFLVCLRRALACDVVFAQDPLSAGLPALLAAKVARRPLAIRVAGDYAWEQSRQRFGVTDSIDEFQRRRYGMRTELLRRVQHRVVGSAELVVTPSDYFRRLVGGWVRDPAKVQRVYNGLALGDIACAGARRDRRTILSAGRLVPWKGFCELIQLMPDLPEWRLVIAGGGPERKNLESKIKNLELAGRVRLTGGLSQAELLAELCRATVFILNTSFESFSFQVVTAMAAGAPVVTTNIGNLPEIVADGREGILVAPDDRRAIVAAVKKIAGDPAFREAIVANARTKAESFSIGRTAEELLRLLGTLRA